MSDSTLVQVQQIETLAEVLVVEPIGLDHDLLSAQAATLLAYSILQRFKRGEQGVTHLIHSDEGDSKTAYLSKDEFFRKSTEAFTDEQRQEFAMFLNSDPANWLLLTMWPDRYSVIYLQLGKLPGGEE